jgi:hypothetical protein
MKNNIKMKKAQELKLIEGIFSPKEALEILISLYTNKIKFHELKNFSSLERFGKEDKIATKRIPQLKKSLEKISKLMDGATKKQEKLIVKSIVNISFVASKK